MAQIHPRHNIKQWNRLTHVIACILMALCTAHPSVAFESVSNFGANPGELSMFLHRPSEVGEGLPLVIGLHGCTQTSADFDDETGLVALSEEIPFLLLLPEQRVENMSRRCFRWYDESDNRHGNGETASIMKMVDFIIETEKVDPNRVFVMGLSAGGAMSAVLMANHPGRFAGGAIFAGLPFGCNRPTSTFDIFWKWLHFTPFALDGADASLACGIAGFSPTDRDASEWAAYVIEATSATPEHWPLISLWQGAADTIVDPDNLRELTEQWTAVHGIDAIADERQSVGSAVREVYLDEIGHARIETWTLQDFGHGFPIDADGDPMVCGMAAGFVMNANLCAIRRVADFWGLQE